MYLYLRWLQAHQREDQGTQKLTTKPCYGEAESIRVPARVFLRLSLTRVSATLVMTAALLANIETSPFLPAPCFVPTRKWDPILPLPHRPTVLVMASQDISSQLGPLRERRFGCSAQQRSCKHLDAPQLYQKTLHLAKATHWPCSKRISAALSGKQLELRP